MNATVQQLPNKSAENSKCFATLANTWRLCHVWEHLFFHSTAGLP